MTAFVLHENNAALYSRFLRKKLFHFAAQGGGTTIHGK